MAIEWNMPYPDFREKYILEMVSTNVKSLNLENGNGDILFFQIILQIISICYKMYMKSSLGRIHTI